VIGKEHIPKKGPAIVAVNHINLIDPPLMATCLPRRALFLAKQELLGPGFWGYLRRQYGGIPVRRDQADLAAVHKVVQALGQGHLVVIFPEGTRSTDARLARGQAGVALVAMRSGAPIIPVAISGSEVVKLPGIFLHALVLRPKVRIVFGEPFYLPKGRARAEQIRRYTDIMMEHIAVLLPEQYRGEYAYVGQEPSSAKTGPSGVPS
jgi:1-acyl-sn-glycerol-3-phosphate acyltransferase